MARVAKPIRHNRQHYRSGTLGLPHPSWRYAVAGRPEPDGRSLSSADEFWEALGL